MIAAGFIDHRGSVMRARAKGIVAAAARIIGVIPVVFFFGTSVAAAQNPKEMTPELQELSGALDKYRDWTVAVHDGYFSTVGCVEYPKAGVPGQVPYRAGEMGVHFFNGALMGQLDPMKPQVLVYQPEG